MITALVSALTNQNVQSFQGTIAVASDFPTLATVQVGYQYNIIANVTDNDPAKTNTGQSFLNGEEIFWNGTNWTAFGLISGTVTSVSVVTANGFSGSVANPTTTPAITLTAGDITPSSVTVTGAALRQKPVVANSSTAYTIDQANGGQFDITLNSATPVLTLASVTAAQSQVLHVTLIQDGSGGRVPSWANVTWAAGVAPTVASDISARTYLAFISDGTTWTGYLINILAQVNTWTASQNSAFTNLTDAATITPDFSLSNNYRVTLGGNRTLGVPTNLAVGKNGVINVRQDITGSRTLAYAWVYNFVANATPVLSTGKLERDMLPYNVDYYNTGAVTITIATPGVITWANHGLSSGNQLQLTTTGALPTGLTASTTYVATVIDPNTLSLSTSFANAQAGTLIATSGSQSGVHTAVACGITLLFNPGVR